MLDWGNSSPSDTVLVAEIKRRTFWGCFCLERLLANGRDRVATLSPADITTQLPQSNENFIYQRHRDMCTLGCLRVRSPQHICQDGRTNLFAQLIRVVDIFGRVTTWHGRGGRYLDARAPWLPDMPFSVLDTDLCHWKATLPSHLDYTPSNLSAAIALGDGRMYTLMWMLFFQARAYLHREYLPFTPKEGYDPSTGRNTARKSRSTS